MKQYRKFVIPALGVTGVLLGFLLANLRQNLVYFRTPTEALELKSETGRIRLGGVVEAGSVVTVEGGVRFVVTDGVEAVTVIHQGSPQQLFQEGVGVVVEGHWDDDEFRSDTMLVKHDEQYRSREGSYQTPTTSLP